MKEEELSLRELADLQASRRKRMEENRAKVKARKDRTRRLIIHGAVAEEVLGLPDENTLDAASFRSLLENRIKPN